MGVIVRQGAQAVEFFLAGCVPEGEFDVDVVDEDVVDVVFKDGGFVDGGEIAARMLVVSYMGKEGGSKGRGERRWETNNGAEGWEWGAYPRVETLRREVFPQAPSPLDSGQRSNAPFVIPSQRGRQTYRRTSLRCTVLLPPQSGMLM